MGRTRKQIMASLPKARRARIAERAAKLHREVALRLLIRRSRTP
jgi:hypothetical protein